MEENNIPREKSVDEAWKENVTSENEKIKEIGDAPSAQASADASADNPDFSNEPEGQIEVTFLNYVSSLVFQAMIFLGELPNPVDGNKVEKNIKQAKFLIDTIGVIRDKTKGNLTKEEDELLNSALYELQMKYVAQIKGTNAINEQG